LSTEAPSASAHVTHHARLPFNNAVIDAYVSLGLMLLATAVPILLVIRGMFIQTERATHSVISTMSRHSA